VPLLQPRLAPAIALAVLGHAAVLSQVPSVLRPLPHGQVAGAVETFPFRTRLLQPPPAAIAAPTLLAAADPQPQQAAPPAPAPPLQPPAEPVYVPRGQLTRAPQPLAEVDVPFPQDVSGLVDLRVQVSLFIDETGQVRRVQFDSAAVPPAFARAVVDTFTRARFSPGEIGRAPVPSQIRIEVEFHAPR
jgi:hypothetical protein